MSKFADSLKEFMSEYNLNNFQLAKILGISSTAVNGYFKHGCIPNIYIAIKICKIFDCSLNYLFGLSDDVSREFKLDEENALSNFCIHLDELIKANDNSVSGTMNALQLDEYAYYHWTHGKLPSTSNIITIAKYFDVSLDFLLGEEIKKE